MSGVQQVLFGTEPPAQEKRDPKQKCRWCAYFVIHDSCWCTAFDERMSEYAAKCERSCPEFAFVDMDAFGEIK